MKDLNYVALVDTNTVTVSVTSTSVSVTSTTVVVAALIEVDPREPLPVLSPLLLLRPRRRVTQNDHNLERKVCSLL
jgi:hypothetical protein